MTSDPTANQAEIQQLALYYYNGCGYCALVRRRAQQLNVELELRDVRSDRNHYNQLLQHMGRGTVPVLHITYKNGEVKWLPESRDIVAFLDAHFQL